MARVFLGIYATSIESERLFSKAGILENKLRNSLSSKSIDKHIFININESYLETLKLI